ncbi:hypothetical protein SDC9_09092 [bioreactor metagenome]|uniref:Uncharacterized protein n=1 Tax=bioreactor metagenome TaxID=1076179 RepID=A0A644T9G8_9ZZZZ
MKMKEPSAATQLAHLVALTVVQHAALPAIRDAHPPAVRVIATPDTAIQIPVAHAIATRDTAIRTNAVHPAPVTLTAGRGSATLNVIPIPKTTNRADALPRGSASVF